MEIDDFPLSLSGPGVFLLFAVPAVLFSPVGEEIFFRGMTYTLPADRWGGRSAGWISALAFAGIHLFHHSLFRDPSGVHFRWIPGGLWFGLMILLRGMFTVIRKNSGSSWPGAAAHAAFNLSMNVMILLFFL